MSFHLAPCPFCGKPVRLVYDNTVNGTCYGISHKPDECSILPTVWGVPNIKADTMCVVGINDTVWQTYSEKKAKTN